MKARWAGVAVFVLFLASIGRPSEAAIACGATITHSVVLHQDIGSSGVPCSADGLQITKSGVTLDLGSHYIWGSGSGFDGIHVLTGVHDVTIERGTVRGFSTGNGIHSDAKNTHLVIQRIVAAGNFRGMLLSGSAITVAHSIVSDQPDVGIGITGKHASVRHNLLVRNQEGISVGGSGGSITNNVVTSSSNNGIFLTDGRIAGNLVVGSARQGITFSGRVSVIGNKVIANGTDGIYGTGSGSTFVRNKVVGSGGYGIEVDAGKATYDRNIVDGSGSDGIYAFGSHNVISHNVVRGSGLFGIEITGGDVEARANRVIGSDHDGIRWSTGNGVAKGNVLIGNGFGTGGVNGIRSGIDASGATVTGSNLAEANDDRECNPVSICTHNGTNIANFQNPACGTRITVSVKLAHDVGSSGVPCTGKGLIVDNPNVTIDLNGFTIWGNGSTVSGDIIAGVFIGPKAGVHVLNGRILGFQVGVFKGTIGVENGKGLGPRLDGLVIGNSADGVLADGKDLRIAQNAFVANPSFEAVNASGTGVVKGNASVGNVRGFLSSFGILLKGNVSRYDHGAGITTVNAPVLGNIVIHSKGPGIDGFDGPMRGNEVVASGFPATGPPVASDGIVADGSHASASNNISAGNNAAGLNLSGSHATAEHNLLVANAGVGGDFAGANAAIVGNRAIGNGTQGIRSGGSLATMKDNKTLGNVNDGISAQQDQLKELDNVANANGDAGIADGISTSGVTTKNTANGNGYRVVNGNGLGILAPSEHGQNRADGNDDATQCAPTSLC